MHESTRILLRLLCAASASWAAAPAPALADSTVVRTGSGFAISQATHIVTNAHVVAECGNLRVQFGAEQSTARVIAVDAEADLAVVQTAMRLPKTIAMRSQPAVRLGESVVAFGFPLSGSLSQGGNLTTGNVSALAGLRDDTRYLQVTAPVQPGNSGGPLLDAGGNLLGVVTAKLDAMQFAKRTGDIPQNVNFAVKSSVLETFLRANNIAYDVAVTDRQLSVADVAEMAKEAAVRLVCSPTGAPAGQPETVRVSPPVDPPVARDPVPVPLPAPEAGRRMPVPSDAVEEQMAEQVALLEVRTPYPGTAPAQRELVVSNRSAYSVLQITVGWMEGTSARECPRSPAAYRGSRDLFVSLKPGETATTIGEFSDQAKFFCVLAAQFLPAQRKPAPQ